jgi:hypothetical protein
MKTFSLASNFTRTLSMAIAVLGLAGSGQAQSNVYSVNIVGYVNKPLPTGFTLVANPLNDISGGNTIVNLFHDTLNINSIVAKWTGSGYASFTYLGTGQWVDQNHNPIGPVTLGVGEGAVVWNPSLAVTNTFVGQVEGYDPNTLPDTLTRLPVPVAAAGIHLLGSVFPTVSTFADIIGRAPTEGDAVMKIDAAGNPLVSYFSGGLWFDPLGGNNEPMIGVAESAFFDTTGNQFAGFALPTTIVPEPGVAALLGLGLIALRRFARR